MGVFIGHFLAPKQIRESPFRANVMHFQLFQALFGLNRRSDGHKTK